MECARIYDHADGEGAAGKALTVSAVTRVDHKRRLNDLVAKSTALAAAGLRRSRRTLPINDLKRRYHSPGLCGVARHKVGAAFPPISLPAAERSLRRPRTPDTIRPSEGNGGRTRPGEVLQPRRCAAPAVPVRRS